MRTMPKPPLAAYTDWTLLFLRVSVGATFIAHGMMKWGSFNAPATDSMSVIMKILAIIEPLAGSLLIVGIVPDVAAVVLAIVMIGAVVTKFTAGGGFTGKGSWEFDLLLLVSNLVVLSVGTGRLSVDAACAREDRHWWQFWKR